MSLEERLCGGTGTAPSAESILWGGGGGLLLCGARVGSRREASG